MNVLIIPDKFKGSLTAVEVIEAIETGLKKSYPGIKTHSITASDGGDGFLDAIQKSDPSIESIRCETSDPIGRPIQAIYGWDPVEKTAFVEMARASGMELLAASERNPLKTSTVGTGTLICDAIQRGARKVYIGLGGSATNDGGIGIAHAIGYRFLDESGQELLPNGTALESISSIITDQLSFDLSQVQFFAINDVTNPLLGETGAAAVYGPQKGADENMVRRLDAGLNQLQQTVISRLHKDIADVPGSGAAGGTGYGLKAFLNAEFLSGIEFVLSTTGIEKLLQGGAIDWIVTGEGKIDDQTTFGKLVNGVAKVGQKHNVPVVAVCGKLDLKNHSPSELGLSNIVELHRPDVPVQYTIDHARELLETAVNGILAPTPQ